MASKEELAALIARLHPAFRPGGSLRELQFKEQQSAFSSQSLLNAILCTRRAGKSFGAGLEMVETAKEYPGCLIPYITLTATSGKKIMGPILREIKDLYHQPLEDRADESTWTVTKGKRESTIFIAGADQKNFLDRLRGPKYPLVIIDEAAFFRANLLENLIDEIFVPAVSDYNGRIFLVGTPGPIPMGYFYEASLGLNGFERFFWRNLDNPYLPDPQGFMDALLKRKNWTRDTPRFRREWLGEWVLDTDSLVYKISDERNVIDHLPEAFDDWHYLIGVDVGYHDKTAMAVLCYTPQSRHIYVLQTLSFSEMIPSDCAEELIRLIEHFEPDAVVMDTGGLGKSIAEEFRRRYHLPIKPAEKTDKLAHIEMLNDDLQTGSLRIVRSGNPGLIHQMKTLQKLENGKEDPSIPNDEADAVLYAWREAKHYTFEPREVETSRNSDRWAKEYWERKSEELNESKRDTLWKTNVKNWIS